MDPLVVAVKAGGSVVPTLYLADMVEHRIETVAAALPIPVLGHKRPIQTDRHDYLLPILLSVVVEPAHA